jgi:hypothetical protein
VVTRDEFTNFVETDFEPEISALGAVVLRMAAGGDSVPAEEIASAVRDPGRTDDWLFARL